jgi:hypothetical protein
MTIESYTHYANLWASVKPIRGRNVDVRPIGQRRRDWEQIVRKPLLSGEYSYVARLYATDCVEYFPNGDIVLRTGGWATNSTGEFIHEHSPFLCFKQNKKLWVKQTSNDDATIYPLGKEMLFKWTGDGYAPDGEVLVRKRVVNRSKAKAAREPLQPFLSWANAFLTLSDGWVMHETMKEVLGWGNSMKDSEFGFSAYQHASYSDNEIYNMATDPDKQDEFLKVLCLMVKSHFVYPAEKRMAEVVQVKRPGGYSFPLTYEDVRIPFKNIKNKLYRMVTVRADVIDIKEVKPTSRTMSNVV